MSSVSVGTPESSSVGNSAPPKSNVLREARDVNGNGCGFDLVKHRRIAVHAIRVSWRREARDTRELEKLGPARLHVLNPVWRKVLLDGQEKQRAFCPPNVFVHQHAWFCSIHIAEEPGVAKGLELLAFLVISEQRGAAHQWR